MNAAARKRAAVCAMYDFGLSNRPRPSAWQAKMFVDYLVAIKAYSQAERMMGALRIASRCVKGLTPTQHDKILIWVREIANKGA